VAAVRGNACAESEARAASRLEVAGFVVGISGFAAVDSSVIVIVASHDPPTTAERATGWGS
jgi:hypothetical protein